MFLPGYWQQYFQSTQNTHQIAQKRMVNAIKRVSISAKKRFRPYIHNGTSDRHKIATYVLKKEHKML